MNRLVTTQLPAELPPVQRPDRTRALFLTLDVMGWSTYASTMVSSTAVREDIDAVHLLFSGHGVRRLFSAPIPGGRRLLDSNVRRVLLAGWLINRWLTGTVDISQFDVVHITPQQYGYGFLNAVRRSGVPLSTLIDSTLLQEKGELNGRSAAEVGRRWGPLAGVEQAVFEAASLVVATSRWAADAVTEEFGVRADKLLVSPLALPDAVVHSVPAAEPTHRIPRILFVGTAWHRKGGDRLLAWHQERWADTAELHVCTTETLSRARNVVIHGHVPHDKLLAEIFPAMDLFVLPTKHDMSPWAVLEAAAVGLPVVSSAIGGIGEMVVDGVTGYLRAPADDAGFIEVIERLLGDPALRARMGAAGRNHIAARSGMNAGHEPVLDRLVQLGRADRVIGARR